MFKYAFVIGIVAEWLLGPEIGSPEMAVYALVRALIAMLAAWMVLEALRLPVRAVKTLDDKTRAERAALQEAAATVSEERRKRRRRKAEVVEVDPA